MTTNATTSQPKPQHDPDKLAQALSSFAGVVEKAQTIEEVRRAGHQLKVNVKQAKVRV